MAAEGLRRATKAGTWYSRNGKVLRKELEEWLQAACVGDRPHPRAIIAPHAGYSYSGPTAAFAYGAIKPEKVKRVYLLGPSHYKYLETCEVSIQSACETPLGNIEIDTSIANDLIKAGFTPMKRSEDEAEHSLELHMPYIRHVMQGVKFTIIPIMVGKLSKDKRQKFASTLLKYFLDPTSLFIISSDFCHWGKRFQYQRYDKSKEAEIWEYIERLDRMGMDAIKTQSPQIFKQYLQENENPTICGRHPIEVLLTILDLEKKEQRGERVAGSSSEEPKQSCTGARFEIEFTKYAQSSKCVNFRDSSVSYASALVYPSSSNSDKEKK